MTDKPEIVSVKELERLHTYIHSGQSTWLVHETSVRLIHTVHELLKAGQRWSDFANDIAINNWQDYTESRYQALRSEWDSLIKAHEGGR